MTKTDGVAVDSPDINAAATEPADPEPAVDEGELIEGGPDDLEGVLAFTLERAASEYFLANAKRLNQQQRVAVTRFVSWAGSDRELPGISAHEMTLFQDAQGANVADLGDRLLPVKAFLAYAKKKEWSKTNLGVHLRVKKTVRRTTDGVIIQESADEIIEMTVEGLELARNELSRLRGERPVIAKKLEEAMADKDFRENAPLDAARDEQAMLEARIRDLEHTVHHSRVSNAAGAERDGRAHMGSSVKATNLVSKKSVEYTLVGQNEVDAAAGRISIASPVGRALVGSTVGDEVEVEAPSGTIRFRVEEVSG